MKYLLITTLVFASSFGGLWAWIGGKDKPHNGPVSVVFRKTDKITGKLTNVVLRLQAPNGDWKEIDRHYDADGNITDEHVKYAIDGRGIFMVDEGKKELNLRAERPKGGKPTFNETLAKASPGYIGETSIAGVRVLKFSVEGQVEIWASPEYNGLQLRIEDETMLYEAVSVQPGLIEPLGEMPEYPVTHRSIKNQIKALEELGQQEKADKVRKSLEK